MCPQVRVIFPLAQIRAELKSQAKVTALPPEILCQTPPPPPHRAEVREHTNSAQKCCCCCASFVTSHFFGGFLPFPLVKLWKSPGAAAPVVFSFCLLWCLCRTVTAMNFGLFKGWRGRWVALWVGERPRCQG